MGRVRWVICALLFFATTINYVDRAVLGVLAPTLRDEIGWTDGEYGKINAAFTLAYAIGFLFVGWFIDRVGTRSGYTIYLIVWSLAAAAHALARDADRVSGSPASRSGIGESGNFPAAIKTTAEWFPRRERAIATGIFNAGSNVGAILAPPSCRGWRSIGAGRRRSSSPAWPGWSGSSSGCRCTAGPRSIRISAPRNWRTSRATRPSPRVRISWLELLRHRQTWAFAIGKFLTDSVWWFYLFWFPLFMADTFGFDLRTIGLPMITVYLLADVGSVGGGWLSSYLLKRGWTPNAARKTAMLVCAILIVPVAMAPRVENPWVAVWLVGVAAAAHQGFSANMFTLARDMFPQGAVGSVVGIGGFAGAMGGFLMNLGAGWFRENQGSYVSMFMIAGVAYLVAIAAIHLLVPRLEPARLAP